MYRKARLALPFLIPGLAGILIFYVVPFFGGIWYSLTDGSFENKFVGAENYIKVWGNQMFQLGLKNTMELSLICAPGLFLVAFLLSALLNRIRPAGAFFRSRIHPFSCVYSHPASVSPASTCSLSAADISIRISVA